MIRGLKQNRFIMVSICMFSALLLGSCLDSFDLPDLSAKAQKTTGNNSKASKAGSSKLIKLAPSKKIVSEKLLDAEGHWYIADNSQSYDPAEAHLKARNSVNIKRRKTNKNLSAHFKPDAQSGEDGTLRILRLEPKDGAVGGSQEYEVAQSIVTSPESVISGQNFDETKGKGYADGTIIVPPTLPKRRVLYTFVDKKNDKVKVVESILDILRDEVFIPVPSVKPHIKRFIIPDNIRNVGSLEKPSLVSKLRTGINSGKVRVVIEVSYATKYKVAIDPLRNVLRVKMENTLWDIGAKGSVKGSSLLGTYVVREKRDGSALFEIRLKKKAKIVNTMVLRPYKKSGYRVVIDLKTK